MVLNSHVFYNTAKKSSASQKLESKEQRSSLGAPGVVSEKPQPGFLKRRFPSNEFANSSPEVAPQGNPRDEEKARCLF